MPKKYEPDFKAAVGAHGDRADPTIRDEDRGQPLSSPPQKRLLLEHRRRQDKGCDTHYCAPLRAQGPNLHRVESGG